MQVIDEVTRNEVNSKNCKRIIVGWEKEGGWIEGYTSHVDKCISACIRYKDGRTEERLILGDSEAGKNVFFSNLNGYYMCRLGMDNETYIRERYTRGNGGFPYHFERRYEAVENFSLFNRKQKVIETKKTKYPISKHLKYTFGLEFETSEGYIPEDLCFRDGLIPLRDGSISGLEYSTVVLEGNKGISLLHQSLHDLRKFTGFNKECSLHIHMGGYPLEPDKIYALYVTCFRLQSALQNILPALTFRTSKYKASGKDYCNLMPAFYSFDELFQGLVGRRYMGSLVQPHPNDLERKRKWQITTRYYWLNLINMICYDINKTVEFRFLRPTYNFRKIVTWIYIFNGILKFCEENWRFISHDLSKPLSLVDVMRRAYPREVADKIEGEIVKLSILVQNQHKNGDNIGQDISFEEELFPEDILL